MSTKTNKTVKPTKKAVENKKNVAKTCNCNKAALAKAIKERENPQSAPTVETKSRFHIWDVYGVKFLMDDNMVPTRRVSMIEVTSDHDTANEPDLRNALIDDAERQLIEDGFFMTDVDAMEDALLQVERGLDGIRHDIKYNPKCPKCAAHDVETAVDYLEYLRGWRNRRFALADELGGTCNLPPVIPNDYRENWHVDGDKLVPNQPKPKVIRTTTIEGVKNPADLAKAITATADVNGLPKELAEKLSKAIPQIIGNAIKQLPNNQQKQIEKK